MKKMDKRTENALKIAKAGRGVAMPSPKVFKSKKGKGSYCRHEKHIKAYAWYFVKKEVD